MSQFSIESLLSTWGAEIGMLQDFEPAVRQLSSFAFRLIPPKHSKVDEVTDHAAGVAGGGVRLTKEGEFYVIELQVWPPGFVPVHPAEQTAPVRVLSGDAEETKCSVGEASVWGELVDIIPKRLRRGHLVHVYPVLFTQVCVGTVYHFKTPLAT